MIMEAVEKSFSATGPHMPLSISDNRSCSRVRLVGALSHVLAGVAPFDYLLLLENRIVTLGLDYPRVLIRLASS